MTVSVRADDRVHAVSVAELAGDATLGLGADLDENGSPTRPIVLVDLEDAETLSDDLLGRAATAARQALPLTVGVHGQVASPRLRPLLAALTLTLVSVESRAREVVAVPDPDLAADRLTAAATACPVAAVTLGRLLRQVQVLDVRDGLAAESAAYSTLLGGREFARWLASRAPVRPDPTVGASRLQVERRGDVLHVTLDREARRNAVDGAMREALVDALRLAAADPGVCVEMDANGPDFCSGGDLDAFGTFPDVATAHAVRLASSPAWLMSRCAGRLHVRVHGACVGAGAELPSFAGRVTAAESAYFVLPEIAMGLVPGAGGTVGITRRIGRWRTAWLVLSGASLDARTAHAWGLVDAVQG